MKKIKELFAVIVALWLECIANGKRKRKEKKKTVVTEAGVYTSFFWKGHGWSFVEGDSDECMKALQKAVAERKSVVVVRVHEHVGDLSEWMNRALLDQYLTGNEEAMFLWEQARYSPVIRNSRYFEFVVHLTYNTLPSIDRLVDEKVASLAGCFRGSEMEKALQVCEFLGDSVRYTGEMAYSAFNVLFEGIGTCRGYALVFQLLMHQMGIECHLVSGWGVADRHCWNAVKLDGVWYSWDPTWVANNSECPWLGWQEGLREFAFHRDVDNLGELLRLTGE